MLLKSPILKFHSNKTLLILSCVRKTYRADKVAEFNKGLDKLRESGEYDKNLALDKDVS